MPKIKIDAEDLAVARGQLVTLSRFAEEAIEAAGVTWADWPIAGAIPAYPLEYDPVGWQEDNWAIWQVWDHLQSNVRDYCPELLSELETVGVKCEDLIELSEAVSNNIEDYI